MRRTGLARSIDLILATGLAAVAPAAFADEASAATADSPVIQPAITIIDRAQIERSGDFSVADLLRDTVLAPFGNWKPQSGSDAQSLATIDLRGLGFGHTLVLIDGRRTATYALYPFAGTDLNAIPLAMVERIEIIPEGASARYGADAVGGVVNIVTRQVEGAELRYGVGDPSVDGGDVEALSAVFGARTERTSITGGAAKNRRGMTFTRDQVGGDVVAYSQYGNSYLDWRVGIARGVPGFGCEGDGFFVIGLECAYDFNRVAADEASIDNESVFVRGRHAITDAWEVRFDASSATIESFGRYAPTPAFVVVSDGSPNDINFGERCGDAGCATDGLPTQFWHRFAAAGNRDDVVHGRAADVGLSFAGAVTGAIDVEFGLRRSDYGASTLGRGYLVDALATAAAESGDYDFTDPFGADPAVLAGMTATISRDAHHRRDTAFASGRLDWALPAGLSQLAFGLEAGEEAYQDLADSLTQAGAILGGSADPSGAASRDTRSAWVEWNVPLASTFAARVSGRHDVLDTTKTESVFSPKVSLRWQPLGWLGVRGSWGESFVAPPLDAVGRFPRDAVTSLLDPLFCTDFGCDYDVTVTRIGNPELDAAQSTHWTLGVELRPAAWLVASVDVWDIDLDEAFALVAPQSLVFMDAQPELYGDVPDGLSVTRAGGLVDHVVYGYANLGSRRTRGVDLRVTTDFDFGDAGRLRNRLDLTKVADYDLSQPGWDVTFEDTYGHPSLRASLQNVWTVGDFEFGWTVHHVGGHDGPYGPAFPHVDTWTTHDVSAAWQAPWNASIAVGATNVGDEQPELLAWDERPWNFYLYDGWGRTLWASYTQRF